LEASIVATLRFTLRYFEEIVAGTFLVLMSVATLANVAGRYGFNNPIPWAEEFSRYAFIWLGFIGAVLCTKHKRHICIEVVVVFLPRRVQLFFKCLADAAVLTLMFILLYYGSILAASASHLTSTLRIPTYFVYMVAPLSACLILLRSAMDFYRDLHSAFGIGGRS
jgi:TRAP-type C4-dicarboxylate transport system permease small subunit